MQSSSRNERRDKCEFVQRINMWSVAVVVDDGYGWVLGLYRKEGGTSAWGSKGRKGGNILKRAAITTNNRGSQPDFLISLCNCAFQLMTLQPFPSPRFRFPTHPPSNWHFRSTCINKDNKAKKSGMFLPPTHDHCQSHSIIYLFYVSKCFNK